MQKAKLPDLLMQLFKPVVRFCLRRGYKFQEMQVLFKRALIEVTAEEISQSGATSNIARLSLLSGIQRREIRQLQQPGTESKNALNLLSRIIGSWQSHPDFSDGKGKARPLGCEGTDSEFAALVRKLSADVNPYTVLFALEQSAAVEKKDHAVVLKKAVYSPDADEEAVAQMLSQDSAALFSSVEANVKKPEVPNLHITTIYDNLCLEDLEDIRAWLLDRGTTLHEEARAYLAARDKDANPRLFKKVGGGKVTLCAFSFVENPTQEVPSEEK